MEGEFIYDVVLDAKDICNMKKELQLLLDACESGKRVVVYGRRNTGKTSLVKSLLIPSFAKRNKPAFTPFVDFMGVDTIEDISRRMRAGFERAFVSAFPLRGNLRQVASAFKTLRPSVSMTPDESLSLSLTTQSGAPPHFSEILSEVQHISKTHATLLVFDEFQDIAAVSGAEAEFRDALQNLSHKVPVLVLGSKKHLLSDIFAKPKAPFHNWGEDFEIGPLPYEEYHEYMNQRFERFGLAISPDVSRKLQDRLQRVPEAVNMVCRGLVEMLCGKKSEITEASIEPAISRVVEGRGKRFEQYMTHFSPSEEKFLIALAKEPGVTAPQGKEFIAKLALSGGAVRKAQLRLEKEAVILRGEQGYVLADPLLAAYLRKTR